MGDWAQVEPLFKQLLARHPSSVQELEQWLADYSELSAAHGEEGSKRYIAMTTQTDDPVREAAYQKFIEEIVPRIKPLVQEAEKAYLASPYRAQLPAAALRRAGSQIRQLRWRCSAKRMFRSKRRTSCWPRTTTS